jgi:hypothetical protein
MENTMATYDMKFREILVGCSYKSFPIDGGEWTNASGRACATSGQSNWGGNDSVREIIAWSTDGQRRAFPVPWTAEDIAEIRRLIAE